jgi:hypothetical protein
VRSGGNGSSVEGARVVVDQDRPRDQSDRGSRLENGGDFRVEGVTNRNAEPLPNGFGISVMGSCTSAWIENADVAISGDEVTNAIVTAGSCGDVTLYKSHVEMNTPGGFGIEINDGEDTGQVLCEHVDFVGDVGDDTAKAAIRNDRDGTRFGAVAVDQPGGSQRRAVVNTGDDVTIYDGVYRASEYPIIDLGDGTHVEEIYAKSYDDREAYCLYPDSANVYLKNNTLRGGIKDYGCDGLKTHGNEF